MFLATSLDCKLIKIFPYEFKVVVNTYLRVNDTRGSTHICRPANNLQCRHPKHLSARAATQKGTGFKRRVLLSRLYLLRSTAGEVLVKKNAYTPRRIIGSDMRPQIPRFG